MKIGTAEIDITPPVGCWILGPVAPSTGVHDPLYARAFVLDDGFQKTAILGIDLIGFGWELSDQIRSRIKTEAAVDGRQTAEIRMGRAQAQVGFNRRVMHEDGIWMEPNPDGPVVPWVDTLSAHAGDGRPIAVMYCHAAHPSPLRCASTLSR